MNCKNTSIKRRLGTVLLALLLVFTTALLVPGEARAASAPPSKITATTSWQTFVEEDYFYADIGDYKIVVPKDGILYIWSESFDTYGDSSTYRGADVYIMNTKSKFIMPGSYKAVSAGGTMKIAVKKGTYLLHFLPIATGIKFKVKYKAYTLTSNTTKTKARTMKKGGSTLTQLDPAGTQDVSWFKVVQSKKSKLVITVSAAAMYKSQMSGDDEDDLKVAIYCGSKKVGKTRTLQPGKTGKYTVEYGKTAGKANAGTYYVKIVDNHSATNGIYKVSAR